MAFFKLLYFLLFYCIRGMVFSWPISLTLVAILISECPHAPKQWECKHGLAFIPLGISLFMILWAIAAVMAPPLRFLSLGAQTGQIAMAAEIAAAGYAWYKLEGNRCFFLSLLLVELWFGFWATTITGAIIGWLAGAR